MCADRLAAAQVEWRAAEERLYPLAMADPVAYQQVLGLVGAMLEVLRADADRPERLLQLAERPEELLARLPGQRPAAGPEGRPAAVSDGTLLGAALAIRSREISAAEVAATRAGLIAHARAGGREWVCLEGPPEVAALAAGTRVELHLRSGASLLAGVDPWSGGDPYLLEVVPADPVGERRTEHFRDRQEWRAEYERWRADVATLTIGPAAVSDSG